MPESVRCSECGEQFNRRGFGSHNAAYHGGDAEGEPVESNPDPEPEPEPEPEDDGGGAEPAPEDGGDDSDLDPDDIRNQGREAFQESFDDPDTEVEGDPDSEQVSEDVEDTEDDARDYQCGNCGHGLEYLGGDDRDGGGKACPECGERLYWSKVSA